MPTEALVELRSGGPDFPARTPRRPADNPALRSLGRIVANPWTGPAVRFRAVYARLGKSVNGKYRWLPQQQSVGRLAAGRASFRVAGDPPPIDLNETVHARGSGVQSLEQFAPKILSCAGEGDRAVTEDLSALFFLPTSGSAERAVATFHLVERNCWRRRGVEMTEDWGRSGWRRIMGDLENQQRRRQETVELADGHWRRAVGGALFVSRQNEESLFGN